jgi:hypothetical protein
MKIYIPTRDRPIQKTARQLILANIPYTIVAPVGEQHADEDIVWCPEYGIRDTRNWILDFHQKVYSEDPKIVMLDDDIELYIRHENGKQFYKADSAAWPRFIAELDKMLDVYAHGGVVEKYMSQQQPRNFRENGRYTHVLAYNLNLFPAASELPAPLKMEAEVGEEQDLNIALLLHGKPSFQLTEWAWYDKQYAPGGCTEWRTDEVEIEAGKFLEKKYPGIVTLTQPRYKKPRVRIAWKIAAQRGGLEVD